MATIPRVITDMVNILGSKVKTAYMLAARVHRGEKRKSGELYINHPTAVAKLLFDAGADVDVICAALLHDTLEQQANAQQIANEIYAELGDQVLYLVQVVSKDDRIEDKTKQQAAYLKQIKRAFEMDIFAFFIKIADLIHNMSTIGSLPEQRRKIWIKELQYQYLPLFSEYFHKIPLAHRNMFSAMLEQMEAIVASQKKDSQERR